MGAADRSSGVGGNRGGSFEAVELSGGVHLRGLVAGECGLWSGFAVLVTAHWSAVAHRGALFFVEGEGVDVIPVAGGGGGAEVEDPDDLEEKRVVSGEGGIGEGMGRTAIMERRMNPAAEASCSGRGS